MIPRHGFDSVLFGRRTRSLGRGGNRVGVSLVDLPGMVAEVWRMPDELCGGQIKASPGYRDRITR